MEATTLSRKSFYVYFDNRCDLLRKLVEPLALERDAIIAPLLRPGVDMATGAREALVRLARLYATHGPLLRALAEASSEDHEAKRAWRDFLEPVVQAHSADPEAAAETLLVLWSRALYGA
ncbi:MAG TPA: hypothetical protein VF072_14045 [Thermoleophilaceae bacterium]